MKIGFIGLGIMGRPMALNLHAAQHSLLVHDRMPLTDDIKAVAEVRARRQDGRGELRGRHRHGARHAPMWRPCCSPRAASPRG